jgi:HSP20 family protein
MMAITRWDPSSEMMSLRQMMDRLFEDAWVWPRRMTGDGKGSDTLPLDIYDGGDELVVTASLPGIKPEDIDITIQGESLRIQGEMKEEEDIKDEQFHRRERRTGRFYREVVLPTNIKGDEVRADFEDGILKLHRPKAEEAKSRRIRVHGGEQGRLQSGKQGQVQSTDQGHAPGSDRGGTSEEAEARAA